MLEGKPVEGSRMRYDYDGSGKEREVVASAYTLMVYEQEFKSGMIEDVYGKIRIVEDDYDDDGNPTVADFTIDNWFAYVKALWAMLRTGADLARAEGRQYTPVPSFKEWSLRATELDMRTVSSIVIQECQRGFFRTPDTTEAEE